jgi:hypothetical protein
LSRVLILAATFGLLFLGPVAGLAAYRLAVHHGPGKFQGEVSRWNRKTKLSLADNRAGNRLNQPGEKVLLAKTRTASKQKG